MGEMEEREELSFSVLLMKGVVVGPHAERREGTKILDAKNALGYIFGGKWGGGRSRGGNEVGSSSRARRRTSNLYKKNI